MANTDRVMSAPLAIIKVGGVAIGKMKSIRITENVRLSRVVGLGRLTASEMAPLDWTGTLNCGAFLIDLSKELLPGSMLRVVQSVQDWENTLLLNDQGVQLDIMRKTLGVIQPSGVATSVLQVVASIKGCFLSRESFDITEGQISGRDCDFEYITPILFHL